MEGRCVHPGEPDSRGGRRERRLTDTPIYTNIHPKKVYGEEGFVVLQSIGPANKGEDTATKVLRVLLSIGLVIRESIRPYMSEYDFQVTTHYISACGMAHLQFLLLCAGNG